MSHTLIAPQAEAAGLEPTTGIGIRRIGGIIAIAGAVAMLGSAIVMYSTGTDLFAAVDDREMEIYLADVTGHTRALELHLLLWVFGAVSMSCAIALFASTSGTSASALAARFLTAASAGAALVFFPMMFGVIYGLEGHPELAPVAEALGKAATGADDITTSVILGLGLFLAIFSGRDIWASAWLVNLGWGCLAIGVLSFVPVDIVGVITTNLIVLVGEITIVAMGVVGLRGRSLDQVGR